MQRKERTTEDGSQFSRPRWLAICAILLVVLTGCQGQSNDTAGEGKANSDLSAQSRLGQVENKVLKVCTTGDYPPFTVKKKDGSFSGIDVDMAKALAADLGAKVEFHQTSWKALVDDFTAHCDIAVGGISINSKRAKKVFFSVATQEDGKTPITRCENTKKYRTIADINKPGVKSIFPEGGTNEVFARKHYPKGTLITADNLKIFDMLAAGKADVMTTDRSEALYIAHKYPQLCIVHPKKTFDYFEKGYMLPQGDVVFKEYVDQWLKIALKDGTYDKIVRRWVGNVPLH